MCIWLATTLIPLKFLTDVMRVSNVQRLDKFCSKNLTFKISVAIKNTYINSVITGAINSYFCHFFERKKWYIKPRRTLIINIDTGVRWLS